MGLEDQAASQNLPSDVPERYRSLSLLGRGAFGSVFRAQDQELDRLVALKFLAPDRALDPGIRTRFAREATAAARVESPYVARIYDTELDRPQPFLVYELIEGVDLGSRVRASGPLAAKEVLGILEDLHRGLEAIHAKGILHRDVKPANVQLDREGRPHLLDLGMARFEESELTGTGRILGTPAFLPPEVLQGEPVSPGTDLYALAVTGFVALEGDLPFPGEHWMAVLRKKAEFSRYRPERSRGIPENLRAWIECTIAADPKRRPRSVAESLALLRKGSPQELAPGTASRVGSTGPRSESNGSSQAPPRSRPRPRGRAWILGTGLLWVVLLLGGIGIVRLSQTEENSPPPPRPSEVGGTLENSVLSSLALELARARDLRKVLSLRPSGDRSQHPVVLRQARATFAAIFRRHDPTARLKARAARPIEAFEIENLTYVNSWRRLLWDEKLEDPDPLPASGGPTFREAHSELFPTRAVPLNHAWMPPDPQDLGSDRDKIVAGLEGTWACVRTFEELWDSKRAPHFDDRIWSITPQGIAYPRPLDTFKELDFTDYDHHYTRGPAQAKMQVRIPLAHRETKDLELFWVLHGWDPHEAMEVTLELPEGEVVVFPDPPRGEVLEFPRHRRQGRTLTIPGEICPGALALRIRCLAIPLEISRSDRAGVGLTFQRLR